MSSRVPSARASRLRQPHHADLRLGEHRGRDQRVVDGPGMGAEHGVGEGVALADRHRGQRHAVGDIAHRIDGGHAGARLGVHRHRALDVQLDADRIEPEPDGVRHPADGQHHLLGLQRAAVIQQHAAPVRGLLDGVDGDAELEGHAVRRQLVGDALADLLVEAAQHLVAAMHHGDLGAETGEQAGEFQRDIAAALDDDACRLRLQMEHLVGGDAEVGSRGNPARDWGARRSRSGWCAP